MSQARLNLLVIDDDDLVPASLRLALPAQWKMTSFAKPPTEFGTMPIHAALVDMHLTGHLNRTEGIDVINRLREIHPHLEIIAMSGDLDRARMEACLKAGASRFLAKPLSAEELILTLGKIEALILLRDASARRSVVPWIGSSTASQDVRRKIASLRHEAGPILLEGESGTGKEVAAALIHAQESDQVARPFVAINLASLPDAVFESEMFGHMRGAFTGADTNKTGLCEAAHGGDLFFDEIEALPLNQQAKLLRFLETGEIRKVGGKDSTRVTVRVIAATNRNLETMVKENKFREDLLWRLNGRKILLPSLRERSEDIQELAEYFLQQERARRNKSLAPDAVEALQKHPWPGNVRELKRVIEQLSLHAPLPLIRGEDVRRTLPTTTVGTAPGAIDLSLGLGNLMERFEAEAIRQALAKSSDVDEVALLLGISRSSLYKKIKDYNIET